MSLPTAFPPYAIATSSSSSSGTAYAPPKLRTFQERKREKEMERSRSIEQVSQYTPPQPPPQPLQLPYTQPQTLSHRHSIPTHLLGQPFPSSTPPSKPTPPPRRRESVDFAVLRGQSGSSMGNVEGGGIVQGGRELRHQSSMSLGSMGTIREASNDGEEVLVLSASSEGRRPLPMPIAGQGGGISSMSGGRPLPSPLPSQPPSSFLTNSSRQPSDLVPQYASHEHQPTHVLPYPYTMISPPTAQTTSAPVVPTITMTPSAPPGPTRSSTLPAASSQHQQKGDGGYGAGVGRRPLPKPLTNRHSLASFHAPSSQSTGIVPSSFSPHELPQISQPRPSTFDRSDMITSFKSVDRYGIRPSAYRPVDEHGGMIPFVNPNVIGSVSGNGDADGRRALPEPPIRVATTKSLDRGSGGMRVDGISEVRSVSPSSLSGGGNKGVLEEKVTIPSISLPEDEASAQSETPAIPTTALPNEETSAIPIIVFPDDDGDGPAIIVDPPPRTPSPSFTLSSAPAIQVSTDEGSQIVVPSINFPQDNPLSDVPIINLPTEAVSHSPPTHQGPGIFCASCDNAIIGRIVSAMSQRWHPECFKCETCKMLLEHVSSYEHEGRAYCHMDYHDQFAPKCHHCATAIVDSRFVTINDPTLGQRYYHELHFFCAECGDPFLEPSKSSAAGTEFLRSINASAEDDEEDQTKEFVIHGKYAFCEECHVKLHKPKCKGCKKPIRDVAVGALGGKWHKECFTCAQCEEQIRSASFFPKDGKAFCQDCYTASL